MELNPAHDEDLARRPDRLAPDQITFLRDSSRARVCHQPRQGRCRGRCPSSSNRHWHRYRLLHRSSIAAPHLARPTGAFRDEYDDAFRAADHDWTASTRGFGAYACCSDDFDTVYTSDPVTFGSQGPLRDRP